MKNFPRLHSLHTLNIRHHQKADYLFHQLRTDFIGESGAGKSIIADLLQLIFVGPREYRSATQSLDDERKPKTLLLPGEVLGYAFLNIETADEEYVVVGVQIEDVHHGIRLFVIQHGFDLDEVSRLSSFRETITIDDFLENGNVLPLSELANNLAKRGLLVKQYQSTKAYHALLYRSELLPFDLASSEQSLKTYAKIIQAFSRRKTLDPKKPKELIEFLFGDDKARENFKQYEDLMRSVQQDDEDYRLNREEVELIKKKQVALQILRQTQKKSQAEEHRYQLALLQDAYEKSRFAKRQLYQALERYSISSQTMAHWNTYCQQQRANYEEQQTPLVTAEQDALAVYTEKAQPFQRIRKVEAWLAHWESDIDLLPQWYKHYNESKAIREARHKLEAVFTDKQQWEEFEQSEWANGWEKGAQWSDKKISDLEKAIQDAEDLRDFKDVNEPATLCYWAYHYERDFDLYDVSVFMGLMSLYRFKPGSPKTGSEYLSDPDELFCFIRQTHPDKDQHGFYLDIHGLSKYFQFRNDVLHKLDTLENRQEFLKKQSEDSIMALHKLKADFKLVKNLRERIDLLGEDRKVEIINAYAKRNKHESGEEYSPFHISQEEFDACCDCYAERDAIKAAYEDADKTLKNAQSSLQTLRENISRLVDHSESHMALHEPYVNTANLVEQYIRDHVNDFVQPIWEAPQTDFPFTINYQSAKSSLLHGQRHMLSEEEWSDLIKKYEEADKHYNNTANAYKERYSQLPFLPIEQELGSLEECYNRYAKAKQQYELEYWAVAKDFLGNYALELEGIFDYVVLINYLFPKLLDNTTVNEEAALSRITQRLTEVLTHIRNLNKRRLNQISEVLSIVAEDCRELGANLRRIGRFFEDSRHHITGGHRVKLTLADSASFPIRWINEFRRELATSQEFADQFIDQITFEEKIVAAFKACSGVRNFSVDIRELLNPNSYLNLDFSIVSINDSDKINDGSTGQTYAAIALLCIARLSLIGRVRRKGIRFMPIDEAEGLGSNYDMLYDIARNNDYQLVSMSINLVGPFKEGNQYIHMLQRDMDSEGPINYTPYSIFSQDDLDVLLDDTNSEEYSDIPLEHRYNFNWAHYRALRQLYQRGHTDLTINNNPYIREELIANLQWIRPKTKSAKGYEIPEHLRPLYNKWYEEFCGSKMEEYQRFFDEYGIPDEGTHPYKEEDIWSLMVIAVQAQNILADFDKYSLNSFSEEFFKGKGAKYLGKSQLLLKAVKIILKTDANFPGEDKKDNQWRLALECDEADSLILCENVNFLRLPETAKKLRIDLWSIGGNNITAIDRIPPHKIQLTLYYACDWDHAGLHIFSRIKSKLAAKGFSIQLLFPSATPDKYLPVDSPNHFSHWERDKPLSGLDPNDFSEEEQKLIEQLIKADQWIEEESNDLGAMIARFRPPKS